jgi:hypothetical protein
MPVQREQRAGLGRAWGWLLSKLGLFTRREAELYAAKLGELTRDYTRRRDREACDRIAHECESLVTRQGWRAMPPAKVARLCAQAIASTPADVSPATGLTELQPAGKVVQFPGRNRAVHV